MLTGSTYENRMDFQGGPASSGAMRCIRKITGDTQHSC